VYFATYDVHHIRLLFLFLILNGGFYIGSISVGALLLEDEMQFG
jgi:hypothetical protein